MRRAPGKTTAQTGMNRTAGPLASADPNRFDKTSGVINPLVLPRFIPQRQFDAVPQSQLVVDQPQIILHHVLGGPQRIGDLPVLAALGYALDDELFAFARPEQW